MKKSKGFTLIELMITVAIIGILAAIAYPSYQNSIIKGNRANAKAYLMEVAQRQQQYLLDNRAYAATPAALGVPEPAEFSRFYTLGSQSHCGEAPPCFLLVAGPPIGFTARAIPKAGTRQVADGWLELTNTGAKNSEKAANTWP